MVEVSCFFSKQEKKFHYLEGETFDLLIAVVGLKKETV